jgi:hypothetical protein
MSAALSFTVWTRNCSKTTSSARCEYARASERLGATFQMVVASNRAEGALLVLVYGYILWLSCKKLLFSCPLS